MSLEGKLHIALGASVESGSRSVTISSSRRTDLADLLIGKPLKEASTLLPRLFSVCGKAHAFAALKATMGRDLDENVSRSAELLVLAENAREHLLHILLNWQEGNSPAQALVLPEVMKLPSAFERALESCGKVKEALVFPVISQLEVLIEDHVLGLKPDGFLELENLGELRAYCRERGEIAPRALGALLQTCGSLSHTETLALLPDLSETDLCDQMLADEGAQFVARPEWQGKAFETGPLSQQASHPLIKSVLGEHGDSLLLRYVARLLALSSVPQQMREVVKRKRETETEKAEGFAAVTTARGVLFHAVSQENGLIQHYRILAPTEWNFHPRGVACRALSALKGEGVSLESAAAQWIKAIDPCVAFQIEV